MTAGAPAIATGSLDLKVPPYARTLDVTLEPEAEQVSPGDTTTLRIGVTNAAGETTELFPTQSKTVLLDAATPLRSRAPTSPEKPIARRWWIWRWNGSAGWTWPSAATSTSTSGC